MEDGATPLERLGVERIKQYPGKEQVDLKVEVEIPGSWFGGTDEGSLTTAERRNKYLAQAVDYAAVREFKGVGRQKKSKEAAIRFICAEDVQDNSAHEGYWIKLTQWNRYRHDTYKDRREDELPFIPSAVTLQVTADGSQQKDGGAGGQTESIKNHFKLRGVGEHEQKNGARKLCRFWICTQPNCKLKGEAIKEIGSGTGQMFRHLEKCNRQLWFSLRMKSKHSKGRKGEDGSFVELMPFSECLPHHIKFVEHCFLDWEVFYKTRSSGLKAYVQSLNPRAGLPHRNTCIKILGVIRGLITERLQNVIERHHQALSERHSGVQSDIWSEKSCRESFFCSRISMVLEKSMLCSGELGLMEASPMLDFSVVSNTKHSGKRIALLKQETLRKFKLDAKKDICLYTEDGASNNKKSAKLIQAPFIVCAPHQLQRAVLFSTGLTGTPSQNPQLAEAIGKLSQMAAAPHRSVVTSKALQDAQVADGTPSNRLLTTSTKNATRWTGLYQMAHKNRRLEKALRVALTGCSSAAEEDHHTTDGEDSTGDDDVDQPSEEDSSCGDDQLESGSDDEEHVARNVSKGKAFPLAHRLVDSTGFKNNSLLESVLHRAHEVCIILQKHEGMGLSLAWQMARALHSVATSNKVLVVSGHSKEGVWREVNAASLPPMFRKQREIMAAQLDQRFHITGVPDKQTLLALAMDPTLDTSINRGIFMSAASTQELMVGEYRRALVRRYKIMRRQHLSSSSSTMTNSSAATSTANRDDDNSSKGSQRPAKKARSSIGSIMSIIHQSAGIAKSKSPTTAALADEDVLAVVEEEEQKFAIVKNSVLEDPSLYMDTDTNMFNHLMFWEKLTLQLPIHYNLFVAEVGVNLLAAGHNKKVPLLLIATHGSMLEGKEHNRTWQVNLADGSVEFRSLRTKQPQVHALYRQYMNVVDVMNKLRQGVVSMADVWHTTDWGERHFAEGVGFWEINVYKTMVYFYPRWKSLAHGEFRARLAWAMLTLGKHPYTGDLAAVQQGDDAEPPEVQPRDGYAAMACAPLPGSSHKYVRHKTPHRCAYCGKPSYWMCSTCNTIGLGVISVCGSKSRRPCMASHVQGEQPKHATAFMSNVGRERVAMANKRRLEEGGSQADDESN